MNRCTSSRGVSLVASIAFPLVLSLPVMNALWPSSWMYGCEKSGGLVRWQSETYGRLVEERTAGREHTLPSERFTNVSSDIRRTTPGLDCAGPLYTVPFSFMSIVHTASCLLLLVIRSSKTPFVFNKRGNDHAEDVNAMKDTLFWFETVSLRLWILGMQH